MCARTHICTQDSAEWGMGGERRKGINLYYNSGPHSILGWQSFSHPLLPDLLTNFFPFFSPPLLPLFLSFLPFLTALLPSLQQRSKHREVFENRRNCPLSALPLYNSGISNSSIQAVFASLIPPHFGRLTEST